MQEKDNKAQEKDNKAKDKDKKFQEKYKKLHQQPTFDCQLNMMIRDSEICPVFAIIILCPILTEMIRVAGEELANDSNEKKYGLEPSMNSRPPMVAKSKSEVEPSSRAIFLGPPTQLTQEDLELIEQRVEIKVNIYFV